MKTGIVKLIHCFIASLRFFRCTTVYFMWNILMSKQFVGEKKTFFYAHLSILATIDKLFKSCLKMKWNQVEKNVFFLAKAAAIDCNFFFYNLLHPNRLEIRMLYEMGHSNEEKDTKFCLLTLLIIQKLSVLMITSFANK